jgi:hypothetical protein
MSRYSRPFHTPAHDTDTDTDTAMRRNADTHALDTLRVHLLSSAHCRHRRQVHSPVDDGARKVPNRVHEALRRRRHLLRRVPYPESTANPLSLGGSGNMDSVTVCLRGCLPPAWAAYSRPSTCPALTCPGLQTCSHPPEHGMGIA